MSGYGYKPSDFPPPQENELDFPDPPDYLSSWNRIFWCLNRTVRDKILLNRNGQNSKQMFFCVYNGFCTFHVNDIGKDRIEHHFNKNPSHRILEEDFDDWKRLANRWKELRSRRARERSPPNLVTSEDGLGFLVLNESDQSELAVFCWSGAVEEVLGVVTPVIGDTVT